MSEHKYTVNLTELAMVTRVSSVTLRKLIDTHDDFPVLSRGDHGVAYEFDAREVKAWLAKHAEEKDAATASRRADLAQIELELHGAPIDDDQVASLTLADREKLAAARYRENQLAEQEGRLVRADDVESVLDEVMIGLRTEMQALPNDIARRLDLDRSARGTMESAVRQALDRAAARLERLAPPAPRRDAP